MTCRVRHVLTCELTVHKPLLAHQPLQPLQHPVGPGCGHSENPAPPAQRHQQSRHVLGHETVFEVGDDTVCAVGGWLHGVCHPRVQRVGGEGALDGAGVSQEVRVHGDLYLPNRRVIGLKDRLALFVGSLADGLHLAVAAFQQLSREVVHPMVELRSLQERLLAIPRVPAAIRYAGVGNDMRGHCEGEEAAPHMQRASLEVEEAL
mmetsp:Transcript_14666/g.41245  ORF Transcript_14666/g.41245 Transcript_14666/m.41245 type:complete len:205 (-) Transcript_14666:781-1395(-)